jgi:hypothetical protein
MPDGTDRYPVDPGNTGAQLEERLRRIEQTLAALNGRNPLNNGVFSGTLRNVDAAGNTLMEIDGNGLKIYDSSGNLLLNLSATGLRMYDAVGTLRSRVGYINSTSGYGVSIFDEAADLRFEVNDDGYRDPWLPHPMVVASAFTTTTSATFVPVYQGQVQIVTHKGVSISVVVNTDAGTTGEFRLKNTDTGTTTSTVSVPALGSVSQTFQWLHGSALGGGPVRFDVEARRTGGAGNVTVFQPYTLAMADPLQCTATGL